MASAKAATLTPKQLTDMERELKITAASIKNLNPRMCFKVIEWVEITLEFETVKHKTLRDLNRDTP